MYIILMGYPQSVITRQLLSDIRYYWALAAFAPLIPILITDYIMDGMD